jgi:hypothetical protein
MNQQERTRLFAWFVNERERIRIQKELGEPRPWTADHTLATYRFTNVRREDDRVTRWIKYNWRDPFSDHPNLTLAMTLARFLNWPPTLEELGFPKTWQPELVLKILRARRARGEQVWNGAYMITTCGAEIDKAAHLVAVGNRIAAGGACPVAGDTLENAWLRLRQINGLGSFLAAQIIADLKHAQFNPLFIAPDWRTWAAAGPGSLRGLKWWAGRLVAPHEFRPRLHELMTDLAPLIKEVVGWLTAQDYQNCCCEVSKYVKAQAGTHPKQRYKVAA